MPTEVERDTEMSNTKLSYELYHRLRQGGEPAIKVFQAWKDLQLKRDSMDIYQVLGEMIVSITVTMLVSGILAKQNYIVGHNIWIISPSGSTTRQLPLYQALRVVRKKDWQFAEVKPVKVISRREALRMLVGRRLGSAN